MSTTFKALRIFETEGLSTFAKVRSANADLPTKIGPK